MALILSIETATRVCSVAIHHEGKLIAYAESHLAQSHSVKLLPMISQVLANADLDQSKLDAIAISEGPGSYTGLRIGLATAKGLCFANDIPLISVSTLLAMAASQIPGKQPNQLLVPLIDARRMEAYGLVCDRKLNIVESQRSYIFDKTSFESHLKDNDLIFFGDGSVKLKDILTNCSAIFIEGVYPSARYVGELAIKMYQSSRFEDLGYFKPNYLKEFYTPKPPAA